MSQYQYVLLKRRNRLNVSVLEKLAYCSIAILTINLLNPVKIGLSWITCFDCLKYKLYGNYRYNYTVTISI